MSENNVVKALRNTLIQLESGIHAPDKIVDQRFQPENKLSQVELAEYKKYLPEYILTHAKSEGPVRAFLSMMSVLEGSVFETVLKNKDVPIEYVQLVIEKIKEECMKK
jgi:hypothetical protein